MLTFLDLEEKTQNSNTGEQNKIDTLFTVVEETSNSSDSAFMDVTNEDILKKIKQFEKDNEKFIKNKTILSNVVLSKLGLVGNLIAKSHKSNTDTANKFFSLCILLQKSFSCINLNILLNNAYFSLMHNDFLKGKFLDCLVNDKKTLVESKFDNIEAILINALAINPNNLSQKVLEYIIEIGISTTNKTLYKALEEILIKKELTKKLGSSNYLYKLQFYYFNKANVDLKAVFAEIKKIKEFSFENTIVELVEKNDIKKLLELETRNNVVYTYAYSVIYSLLVKNNKKEYSFEELSKILGVSLN